MPAKYSTPRLCSLEACNTKHYAKGLCRKHYVRFLRRGTTQLPSKVYVCVIDGCDKPFMAKGMCSMHYARAARCTEPGCGRARYQGGPHCRQHVNLYARIAYLEKHHGITGGAQECSDCGKDVSVFQFPLNKRQSSVLSKRCYACIQDQRDRKKAVYMLQENSLGSMCAYLLSMPMSQIANGEQR